MKFRIRYADKFVGVLAIAAVVMVILVIVLIGRGQRWFRRDVTFKAELTTAQGLAANMSIQYKGVSVGRVRNFTLNPRSGLVSVDLLVYREYRFLVTEGATLELQVSPIGLGNQFVLNPVARTEGTRIRPLRRDSVIPTISPVATDINGIINSAAGVFTSLNDEILPGLDAVLNGQNGEGGLITAAADLASLIAGLQDSLTTEDGGSQISALLASVQTSLDDLNTTTGGLSEPGGVLKLVDKDGDIYTQLVQALETINAILNDTGKTFNQVPSAMPQVKALISQLNMAIVSAQQILTSLTNNPLLKNGIPATVDASATGTADRGSVLF
jgi:phospholipid/cholesterol/gamma-HCH transport system substrate-binding protein